MSSSEKISEILRKFNKYHFAQYSMDNLRGYLNYIADEKRVPMEYGFWLPDSPSDHTFDNFPKEFLDALNGFDRSINNALVTESELLRDPQKCIASLKHGNMILYIQDCKDEPLSDDDRQKWEDALEVLRAHPEITRFLLISAELREKRFKGFDEVYYRAFSENLVPIKYTDNTVHKRVIEDLKEKGFSIDQAFSDDLYVYITTVYKKADRKEESFIADLLRRIHHIFYQQSDEERAQRRITKDCVPFYRPDVTVQDNEDTNEDESVVSESEAVGENAGTEKPENGQKTEENAANAEIPKAEVVPKPAKVAKTGEVAAEEKESKTERPDKGNEEEKFKPIEFHFEPGELKSGSNVLLLAMSTLPIRAGILSKSTYCAVEKGSYQLFIGESQLEPGTKLFLSKLAFHGTKPDKIIIVATEETKSIKKFKKNNDDKDCKMSAIDVYSENIASFLKNGDIITADITNNLQGQKQLTVDKTKFVDWKNPHSEEEGHYKGYRSKELDELRKYIDVEIIDLDLKDEQDNPLKNPLRDIIYKLIGKDQNKDKNVNLYIDLQGGIRSVMFTMFATTTMLRDKNVAIKDMFAIEYGTSKISQISTENRRYAILDLVSGIRAFTAYGKADELERFLESRDIVKDPNAKDKSNEEKALDIIKKIDGCMQINDPQGFEKALKELKPYVDGTIKYNDSQFQLIVDDLNQTYEPLLKDGSTVLDTIDWFVDKSFLTSALTFVEDKIPSVMVSINGKGDGVIKVSGDDIPTVVSVPGCQKYYKDENNIFNAVFNDIIKKREDTFFRKLCEIWADKLISSCNESFKCQINCRALIESGSLTFAKAKSNKELYLSLRFIENGVKYAAWMNKTLGSIRKLVDPNKDDWNFRATYNVPAEYKSDTKIGDTTYKREDLLDWFNNDNSRNDAQVNIIIEYLKGHTFSFNAIHDQHRKFMKHCVAESLWLVLFSKITDKNKQCIIDLITDILVPIASSHLSVLKDTDLSALKDTIQDNVEDPAFDDFVYLLWKNLLELPDSGIKGGIGEKTHACITISEKDTERLDDTKYWCAEATDDLVEYAKLYVKSRDRIDNPKKSDLCRDRKSYIELFDRIKDLPSCNKYIDAYSDVFPCPEGINRCVTVSGFPKGEYDVIKSAKLKIDLGTTDPNLLDTCILLYQALKKERNTTNHANENTNEHLDPNHTRTAIKVLTKLCRKLTEPPKA
ncbi:MAG: TM1812 family CRISPR-associated protein [Lachnospiraceae bacterium]|nr:TM1812 family CRISPR-associated protein [Lachnospiraceae bacterium]